MKAIKWLNRVIDNINAWVGRGVAWVTLGLVLVVFIDVVMRYLFNTSFVFTQELEWHLFGFIFLIGAAHQTLINKHKVELIRFPAEVLNALRKLADEVVAEEAAKDAMSKKVNDSFKNFQKVIGTWGTTSEKAYYDLIVEKYSLKG